MLKIADIISYKFIPYTSGGQKFIFKLLEHIGRHATVLAIGTANNRTPTKTSFSLHRLLIKNPFSYIDLVGFLRVYFFLKKEGINALIIEHPYLGWMGFLLKKLLGIPLLIHTHNIEYLRFRSLRKTWWPLLRAYETWVLKIADHIFCISEEDKRWMTDVMRINQEKCSLIPFGVDQQWAPEDKVVLKHEICQRHGFQENKPLLLFTGDLSYKPNTDAVKIILDHLLPELQAAGYAFNMLIVGRSMPAGIAEKLKKQENVLWTGFVENIDDYNKAADIFINPVLTGGGVKTKLVEALGMNCFCISTKSGALGVDPLVCGERLVMVEDNDWKGFAKAIISINPETPAVPEAFYEKYSWESIAQKTASKIGSFHQ